MVEFNYSKLEGKIKEVFNSNVNFAIKMGISERTLSVKLNNKSDFRQNEIFRACELLNIEIKDIGSYFFKKRNQQIE